MRPMILAALVLSPVMLHAQAKSSIQPKLAASVLVAGNTEPSALASNTPTTRRVSTGVVAPKLIHVVDVASDATWRWRDAGPTRTAVVEMVVDKSGKPYDLKITQSLGEEMDRNVLAAVSQYRFQPGTVSDQPSAIPVALTVAIVNPLLN